MSVKVLGVKDVRVLASQIPVGTVFTGKIAEYTDRLFLRMEDRIVPIDNYSPGHFWDGPQCPVDNYRVVTSLEVEY